METAFAKIVEGLDGRHSILIEGRIIGLQCDDISENNRWVETIVRGLRRLNGCSPLVSGQIIGAPADQQAA